MVELFDYEEIRDDVVIPSVVEFGKSAVLTEPGPTTGPDYDPTPGTPVEYQVKVMELGLPGSAMAYVNMEGTNLRHDDIVFLMSMEGDPQPTLDGMLTVNGVKMQIVGLHPLRTGPTTVFWKIRCAR